ncbi:MAG: hypothetical protein HYT93_01160 [Parcubacteria group bacterium]|nr:hypothetical protein [Parcubacteria group bacterium]
MEASLNFLGENFTFFVAYASSFFIYALPVVLVFIFRHLWVLARREQFFAKQKYILLQIKVPRDVPKSPLAMEIVLGTFHQTIGESNWYDRYILGKVRADFSLEMISVEGDVRFLIWTREGYKKFIETQIYSQYPTAEIKEVSDYTADVPYAKEGSDWDLFAVEWKLTKPDPYPIKTYVDYGLEKDPKEEFKVDPMLSVIEWLGDLGRGEQAWVQILVRANKGEKDFTTMWRKRNWQEEGKELTKKIMDEAKERSGPLPEDATSDFRFSMLTEGERNVIKAIDRSTGKHGLDCGIRGLYLAKKSIYNPANVAGLFGTMKQYSSNDLNGFKPRDYAAYDYPWQKYINIPFFDPPTQVPFFSPKGRRLLYKKWKFFDAYRRRSWFFPPYERQPYVLNTEELATIYHFPGQVSETPTFKRIESQKAEPPANLPV